MIALEADVLDVSKKEDDDEEYCDGLAELDFVAELTFGQCLRLV